MLLTRHTNAMVNECEYKVVSTTILLAILLLQRRGLPQNWDNIETFEPSFTPIQCTMRITFSVLCSLLLLHVFHSPLSTLSHTFFQTVPIVLADMYSIFLILSAYDVILLVKRISWLRGILSISSQVGIQFYKVDNRLKANCAKYIILSAVDCRLIFHVIEQLPPPPWS